MQGILRTLVQRGIFEETGLPVDTVGLRKVSKARAGDSGGLSMTDAALRKVRAGAHTSRP